MFADSSGTAHFSARDSTSQPSPQKLDQETAKVQSVESPFTVPYKKEPAAGTLSSPEVAICDESKDLTSRSQGDDLGFSEEIDAISSLRDGPSLPSQNSGNCEEDDFIDSGFGSVQHFAQPLNVADCQLPIGSEQQVVTGYPEHNKETENTGLNESLQKVISIFRYISSFS